MSNAVVVDGHARRTPAWLPVVGVVALLVLEVLVGRASVHLSPPDTNVAAYWPGSGISIVALCLALPRWRPAVLAGIFVAAFTANATGGRPLDLSLAFGGLNAAEAATVMAVLTRGGRRTPALESLTDLVRLLLAALVGATVGGFLGGLAVATLADGDLLLNWRALVASHGAAILIIAPLGMRLVGRTRNLAGLGESLAQWVLAMTVAILLFLPDQELPLVFLLYPIVVWGAARLLPRLVTVQLLVLGAVTSVLTTEGYGPLHAAVERLDLAPEMTGTLLQANLVTMGLIALPVMIAISAREETLGQLTRTHALVLNMLDATTSTAILGTDLDGRIEFFNVGAENLTGYRAQDVVGRAAVAIRDDPDHGPNHGPVLAITPEEPDSLALEALIGPFLEGHVHDITADWPLLRADGELRTVSLSISRRTGRNGELIGYLGVADDVTDRRRNEIMVTTALTHEKQLVERLAQVDETKNDFIATVSHELRTPITSIIGYSQLLLSDDSGSVPPMHQQIIQRIERNGRRLMGLIEDMLVMSQVEMGSFRFRQGPLDIRRVALAAIDGIAELLAPRELRLDQQIGDETIEVSGDQDKLERAFSNLLNNAVKFSHAGDVISVSLDVEDGQAVLRVSDTGIGISDEDQAHLFDRFFRGSDARERAIQGAGLGLTIANSIIAGHDGTIEVASTLGAGTTFTVRLPLLTASARSSQAS